MAKERIDFNMTQIGNVSYADVSITNPSSHSMVVQAFLLPSQDTSYAGLKKMLHHLRAWYASVTLALNCHGFVLVLLQVQCTYRDLLMFPERWPQLIVL